MKNTVFSEIGAESEEFESVLFIQWIKVTNFLLD